MDMIARKIDFLERVLEEGPLGLPVREADREVALSLVPAVITIRQEVHTGYQVAFPQPQTTAELERLRRM